jgi:hypothetical protein
MQISDTHIGFNKDADPAVKFDEPAPTNISAPSTRR